jgi:hypothetical protein
MICYVNGKKVDLLAKEFVSKGGEGSIYHKDDLAYKIYEDLSKMIPEAKIKELETLDKPNIVRPLDIIFDSTKAIVGFTMDWLGDETNALCKLFTNSFRDANGITIDQTTELVENIKDTIFFIHNKNCLMVDGNEFNYLVGKDFITPYFIDVNSYQTPNFNATAIMPSIRDWSTQKFTTLSDWFSFAIVSFQLFVGIHPFKGNHPKYSRNDFEKRVIENVSVFHKGVSLPPTVRDFNLIPSSYKDWYYKLFEKGERKEPPTLPGKSQVIQIIASVVQSSNNFEITMLKEFKDELLFYGVIYGIPVAKTIKEIFISKTNYKTSLGTELLFAMPGLIPILIKIENNKLKYHALKEGYKLKELDLECSDKMIVNNVLYIKNNEKLIEIEFNEMNGNIVPAIKTVWTIEPNSSKLFSNIIVQSVLGKTYVAIPLPKLGQRSSFVIKAIPELDKYRIVDAKYDNKVSMFIGYQNGDYFKIVVIFDDDYNKYKIRVIPTDYIPLNFITLDNGVVVSINDDSSIEIFTNRIDKDDVKKIKDPEINTSMRLFKDGMTVMFVSGNKVYKIRMK